MIDANENVTDHILARMLAKMGLKEAVHVQMSWAQRLMCKD